MARPETSRLFFAVWPDATLAASMARLARTLPVTAPGRRIPVRNLHLTLAFLGETGNERIPCLLELAAETGREAGVFDVLLDRAEYWPGGGILGLTPGCPPSALLSLAASLSARLAVAGFETETRPYRPHVTLARRSEAGWRRRPLLVPLAWRAAELVLVASRPEPSGSLYQPLGRWPLGS